MSFAVEGLHLRLQFPVVFPEQSVDSFVPVLKESAPQSQSWLKECPDISLLGGTNHGVPLEHSGFLLGTAPLHVYVGIHSRVLQLHATGPYGH